jgi:hypothetical protein
MIKNSWKYLKSKIFQLLYFKNWYNAKTLKLINYSIYDYLSLNETILINVYVIITILIIN